MKQLRRVLISILILAFTLGVMPAHAETATATTLRLAGSTGTVSITNANGKAQTVKTDMRLYSGYELTTGKQSSAYISLDGTKAVKLDASSKSSVRQAGNKLEVCLDSGNLFFDVTAPLAADESLNIRTSTMVTGIRGSFGWVTHTEVALLHGHVTLTCINPVTSEVRVTELYSGERVYYDPDSTVPADPELKEIDFIKEIVTNDDVPSFVVEEIRNDESLQEALIEDVPSIDVPKLLEDYEEKKAAEDKEIEAREQEINEALEEQEKFIEEDPVDYLFDENGGLGSYSVQVLLPGSLVLTGALTSGDAITPTNNADGSQTYEVPWGDSLTFTLDTTGLYVDGEVQVTLDGTELAAPYEVTTAGTVKALNVYRSINSVTIDTLFDALDTYGAVAITDVCTLTVSGNVKAGQTLMIAGGCRLIIDAGASLTIDEDADLINKAIITNNGTFVNNSSHTFYINNLATFESSGTATNNGRIINNGSIVNSGTMTFAGGSVLENGNGLRNDAGRTLTVEAGATVNNSGGIGNFGDFQNNGTINNTGTFDNLDGVLTNNGTFTADGTATNGGTVTGQSGGITGTLTGGTLTLTGAGELTDGTVWSGFADTAKQLVIGAGITAIGDGALKGYGFTSVTIPADVTSIGDGAFADCSSLESAAFEGAMPEMGSGVFDGAADDFALYFDLTQAGWDEALTDENTIGGYNSLFCVRGECGPNLTYTLYTVKGYDGEGDPDSPNAIRLEITGTGDMYDFTDSSYESDMPWHGQLFIRVDMPEGITHIGDRAFRDCAFIQKVCFPEGGCDLTSIGEYAFYDCWDLTDINIPESVTSIGDGAFCKCTSLKSVTVPAGVTVWNERLFLYCTSLESITIPNGVTGIGDYAFVGCSALKSVTIPDSVTGIGFYAFSECSALESVVIPYGVTVIDEATFMKCSSLTSVTIPDSVTTIGLEAFCECTSLESITIPDSVTTFGRWIFLNCTALTEMTIPDSVTSIDPGIFENCTALKSVTFSAGVTEVPFDCFKGCTALMSLTLPAGITSAGDRAFYDCFADGAKIIFKGTQAQWETFKENTLANLDNDRLEDIAVECLGG